MQKYNILIVDDLEESLTSTKALLHRWGYNVDTASSGEDSIEYFKASVKELAVVLMDYKMPGITGTDAARQIRALNEEVILLVYSAYPSVDSLTATIRSGALNFIDKNDDLAYLRTSLEKACQEFEKVRRVKPPLSNDEAVQLISSIGMVGRSTGLARVAEQIHKYRQSTKPVLILGETGSGKEMVAHALHTGSRNNFYVVNCAAFQGSSLVESELFGHEKGAFTGATMRKAGILAAAGAGTVYLDELHFLDIQTQGKLLRALREKKIRRVGGLQEESVHFRLIASTGPNIEDRVANGTFLPDLYYRLKFLSIEIPPLRNRIEDIEPLVTYFNEKFFRETGSRKTFLMRTIRTLEKYQWPGNVGELDGCISALLTNSEKSVLDEIELDRYLRLGGANGIPSSFAQLEIKQEREKRELIQEALRTSKSVLHAAERLKMKPSSLHTLITRLGIRAELKDEKLF